MLSDLRGASAVVRYGGTLAAVLAALWLRIALLPYLGRETPLIAFVLPVLLAAWCFGLGPGLLATALGAVAGRYFFVEPIGSIGPANLGGRIGIIFFLVTGVAISFLNDTLHRARRRAQAASEAQSENEERYRMVAETATDAIFRIDEESSIHYANPAAERIFGYAAADLVGRKLTALMPERLRPAHEADFRRYLETGRLGMSWDGVEVIGVHRNGREIPLEVSFGESFEKGRRLFTGILRDTSERKRTQGELRRRLEEIQAIYQLSDTVSRAESLDEIYDAALATLIRTIGADRAAILLFGADGVMRFEAWRGLSDGFRRAVEGYSPWNREATDAGPILVEDAEADASVAPLLDALRAERIGALAFIPLADRGRLLGKFTLHYDAPHGFRDEEVRLAQTVARHVAFALERRRSSEALAAVKDELAAQLSYISRLHELSTRLSRDLELDAVLGEVLRAVAALQGAPMGVLMLYDAERRDLYTAASIGFEPDYLEALGRVPFGAGACGSALAERRPVVIEDVELDRRLAAQCAAARLAGYRAVYSAPLVGPSGRLLGAIETCFAKFAAAGFRSARLR